MHEAAYRWVERVVAQLPPRRAVYEIGSRDVNGSVRPLFQAAERYHGVDLLPGPGVDVVADGAAYVPPFVPDTVVCCEVLEHAPRPLALLAQARRVLAPGGVLIVTCAAPERAAHSGLDGGAPRPGEHYRGVGPGELRAYLAALGYAEWYVHHDAAAGDCYAVAWTPTGQGEQEQERDRERDREQEREQEQEREREG